MINLDVIIIGAGPIGIACGIEAKGRGLKYLVIDKGPLVNSLYRYPLNMTFFSTAEKLEIGGVPFISHGNKPTRTEALEYYRRVVKQWGINLELYTPVEAIKKAGDHFEVITKGDRYKSKNIVIATGFYDSPYPLNVTGEELPKVLHYYKEAHPFFNMNIAVVGAANSAVDVALETQRKGAKSVTMIIRESEIGENVKYWVRPDILNRIEEGSIKAYFNSNIIEITEKNIKFESEGKEVVIENDFVLAMTGYQPNFNMLKTIGVKFKQDAFKTPYYDSKNMQSNVEGVFLAGVVCGGLKTNKWFIENSREHAPLIMDYVSNI
ncbi:MAG: YpdA family putative bacillithiol disulfide reductase [Flavobacteriaceae bacterium]|nr:YpdA family putative bacillithiol disulfide reductase [Flavobacteriaceae bacterium]